MDLWGLASSKARVLRQTQQSPKWMDDLVQQADIGLVMIYHNDIWFPQVPENWIKVGELGVNGIAITARFNVSFFATNPEAEVDIRRALTGFVLSLPEGSQFTYSQ